MKILRNIIFVLIVLALIIGSIIVNYNNNTMVNDKDINSIIIVDAHRSTLRKVAGAKEINKQEDIKAICDAFNSSKYKKIEKAERELLYGGGGYVFIFKYSSGVTKNIYNAEGPNYGVKTWYITIGDRLYKVEGTEFEKFWDLDYPIKDLRFNADGTYDENQ